MARMGTDVSCPDDPGTSLARWFFRQHRSLSASPKRSANEGSNLHGGRKLPGLSVAIGVIRGFEQSFERGSENTIASFGDRRNICRPAKARRMQRAVHDNGWEDA